MEPFEVITLFCDLTFCTLLEIFRCVGGTCAHELAASLFLFHGNNGYAIAPVLLWYRSTHPTAHMRSGLTIVTGGGCQVK